MPKKNRIAIYEHLFKEGVMVAKKDFHAAKHPEVEAVPNLHVIKALQVNQWCRNRPPQYCSARGQGYSTYNERIHIKEQTYQ